MLESFKIDLNEDPQGLLWALWKIFKGQGTGILAIQGSSSSRAQQKKEVAVMNGDFLAIRSNWPQDSLRYFTSHRQHPQQQALANLWPQLPASATSDQFVGLAMSNQILDANQVQDLLAAYFYERLFSQLTLRRGTLEYKSMPNLTEEIIKPEIVRLSQSFEKSLWSAISHFFDDAYCKSRFSKNVSQNLKVFGDFPLPLGPQELRAWNQLKTKELVPSELKDLDLRLVCAALEFDLVKWAVERSEKLESELLALQKKFQGADPFAILGISENDSASEAKVKYFAYVKKYHPDRLPANASSQLRGLSELILAQVNEAFDIVSNPERRQELMAEKELEKQGGVEAIEKKVQAEFAFEEAKMTLKRRHFSKALMLMDSIMGYLGEDLEYQVERVYALVMTAAEEKKIDLDKFSVYHKVLDKGIQMRPDYANTFYYKGLLLKFENKLEEALVYFDQAINLDDKLQEAQSEARLIRMRKEKGKDKPKSWFRKKS